MAIKTIRVFAEYTSDGYVPMPSQGNIDYGVTVGSTFPETEPSSFQTDDPNIDVAVTTMTDYYVWIRTHGSSWNPSYTRVVRIYPDSPSINSVVMNMIVAVGSGGTSIGGGSGVSYYLNGGTSQGVLDGSTYYEMSKTPVEGTGVDFFKIHTTGFQNIAQFVTDAGDPGLLNIPAGNWPIGFYFSASDNSGNPKFYAEIYKYSVGGTFTLLGTGSATPEVISNGMAIDYYTTNVAVPDTTLVITDRIAVRIFVNTDGNRTVNLHTQDSHLSTVGTTFTRGLTAINGLIKQVQYIAIGNAGSDAAIVSSDDTHTINLPTASATKRGLLNSTDWSTFNAKQSALSGTGFVKISGSTISYDNSSYQPLDGDLTAIGALAGTTGILKKTAANTWELDTTTYLSTGVAASTYQRLDKMVSNLLASDTEYPNSNAVLAKLALKADAANPVFTGNMTISGAEPKLYFVDTDQNPDYTVLVDAGYFKIYDQTAGATRFQINSDGNISTGVGKSITAGSFIKDGGTASQFLKADGSIDSSTYVSSAVLADYLLSATAATTYQTLANLSTDLTASATKYPSVNAVVAGLDLKQPLDGDLTAIAALTGTSGFLKKTAANTWSLDTSTYLTTADASTTYLAITTAASTYQRLDKMVSNLLASSTEYPNSNAVIAALALKADAANPVFTGNMTISGAEPKLYFTDTDQNPDYFIGVDAGYFRIYNQTAGQTKFVINTDGDATFTNSVTASSIIKSGGTSSQFLMADGSVSTFAGVTGSGTTNYLPKWTSASAIGNSAITDNGTTVSLISRALSGTSATFTNSVTASSFARSSAGTGYLNGKYEGVESTITTGPIYCLSESYAPTSTTLNTMYGIGYSYNNFTGSYGPANTWGMYVAGGGGANIFLGAENGIGYFRGKVLINTITDAGYRLDVNGTGRFSNQLTLNNNILFSNLSETKIGWGGTTTSGAANPLIYSDNNFLAINSKAGSRLYFNYDNTNASSYVDFFAGKALIDKNGAASFSSNITSDTNITAGGVLRGASLNIIGTQTNLAIISNYTGGGDLLSGTLLCINDVLDNNLTIVPSSSGTSGSKIVAAAYTPGAWRSMWEFANVSSGNPNLILVKSGGNVGIGTSTPTGTYGKLSVNGGISILNDNNGKLEIGRYSSGAPNSYIKLGASSGSLNITNNTDAADIFTFTNAGSFGINNTSPVNTAWGNENNSKQLSIDSDNTAVINILGGTRKYSMGVNSGNFYMCYDNTAARHNITVFSSGNVAINSTSDVGYKFDVNGTGRFSSLLWLTRGVNTNYLAFDHAGQNTWYNKITSTNGSSYVISNDYGGGINVLTLAEAGFATFSKSVGIGSSPSAWGSSYLGMQVNSAFSVFGYSGTNAELGSNFYYDGSNYKYTNTGTASQIVFNGTSLIYRFASNGASGANLTWIPKVTMLSNGNVLIGTTTDSGYMLDVNGVGRFSGAVRTAEYYARTAAGKGYLSGEYSSIESTITTGPIYCISSNYAPTSTSSNNMYGIGYSYNNFTNAYGPSNDWGMYVSAGGTIGIYLSAGGNGYYRGAISASSFFESSDIRLKILIDGSAQISGIENLEAKLYEKDGKLELGYFAQDAEKLMPYAVTKNSDGFLNLSYREVHTAKIARLEKEVAELKAKLNAA